MGKERMGKAVTIEWWKGKEKEKLRLIVNEKKVKKEANEMEEFI